MAALLGKIGIDALLASGALAGAASQLNPEVLKDALNKIGLVANAAGEFVIREGTPIGEAVYNATLQGAEISADLLGSIANGLLSLPGGTTVPKGYTMDPLPTDEYGRQLVDQTSGLGIRTYSPDMSSIPQEAINTESILTSLLEAGEEGPSTFKDFESEVKNAFRMGSFPPPRDPEDPYWKKLIQGLAKGGRFLNKNKFKTAHTASNIRQAFTEEGIHGATDSGILFNAFIGAPIQGAQLLADEIATIGANVSSSILPDAASEYLFGNLVNTGSSEETSTDTTDYFKGWYYKNGVLHKDGEPMDDTNQNNKEVVGEAQKVKVESPKVELSKNIMNAIDDAILQGIHGNTKLDSLINNVPGVKDYINNVHGYELE